MTIETFLAWEERRELRWEFDGVEPVAMTGGSNEHEVIGNNLRAALLTALRGKRCGMRGPTRRFSRTSTGTLSCHRMMLPRLEGLARTTRQPRSKIAR